MSSWIAGDLLIRARSDKIVASALADGRESWVFAFPRGNQLCTMSRGIEDNIGIVGYKSDDESHCITMVALDLATGRTLWQRQRGPLPPVPFRTDVDEIAVAGQVALSREASGFAAVDLHDGKPRWRKAAAAGCEVYSVAAEGDTAVLLSACKNHTLALVVADVTSGRERWHARLDISADDETSMGYGAKATTVLSVDPLVIRASDDGATGGAFVSFDAQGRRLATIAQSQQDVDLAPGQFPKRGARAEYLTDVVGDVLVTPARKVGDSADHLLTAYSIRDGRRLWSTEFQEPVTLVVATADKVFVKQDGSPLAVYAVALHDGRILRKRTFATDQDKVADTVAYAADLRVAGDSYVFIGERGETAAPVVVLR